MSWAEKLTKKFDDLPKDWKDKFAEKGQEGCSDQTIYTSVGLSRNYHQRLLESSEEYREVFEYAQDLSRAWWIDEGRKLLHDRNANTAVYNAHMKNRLGWMHTSEPANKDKGGNSEPEKPEGETLQAEKFKIKKVK